MKNDDSFTLKPKSVLLELTRRCNLHCLHCQTDSGWSRTSDEMALEEWKRVIEDLTAFGVSRIGLSGGEPLLREDFFPLLRYAGQKDTSIRVMTSGWDLDSEKARRLADFPIEFALVSIDSADRTLHDWFRGRQGAFDRAVRAVELLLEYGVLAQVCTVVTRFNYYALGGIIALCHRLGVRDWHILRFVPSGRGKTNQDRLCLSPLQRYLLPPMLSHVRRHYPSVNVLFDEAYHYLRAIYSVEQPGLVDDSSILHKRCIAGITGCTIAPNGDVSPCVHLHYITCGNIRKQAFQDIWNYSRGFHLLRSDVVGCSSCSVRDECNGGCPAFGLSRTGNIGPDLECPRVARNLDRAVRKDSNCPDEAKLFMV